jgi:hypothetical protein
MLGHLCTCIILPEIHFCGLNVISPRKKDLTSFIILLGGYLGFPKLQLPRIPPSSIGSPKRHSGSDCLIMLSGDLEEETICGEDVGEMRKKVSDLGVHR